MLVYAQFSHKSRKVFSNVTHSLITHYPGPSWYRLTRYYNLRTHRTANAPLISVDFKKSFYTLILPDMFRNSGNALTQSNKKE